MAKDDDDPGKVWARALVERVGKAVKEARKGKSAAWLSDRTAELGYRISPTVIAKLDSGHRGDVLSVPELIVLAAALNTSPVTLIYPGPYHGEIETLPSVDTSEFDAAQWISGLGYWGAPEFGEPGIEVASEDGKAWVRNTRMLRYSRELDFAKRTRERLAKYVRSEEDQQQVMFYDSQIQWLRNELGIADA